MAVLVCVDTVCTSFEGVHVRLQCSVERRVGSGVVPTCILDSTHKYPKLRLRLGLSWLEVEVGSNTNHTLQP